MWQVDTTHATPALEMKSLEVCCLPEDRRHVELGDPELRASPWEAGGWRSPQVAGAVGICPDSHGASPGSVCR